MGARRMLFSEFVGWRGGDWQLSLRIMFSVFVAHANVIIYKLARANI